MRVQRADGGVKKKLAALCLFQPLSRLAATVPRSGSLLVSAFYCSPSVTACAVPAPSVREPFGLCKLRFPKASLSREVAMSDSELTEGVKQGCGLEVAMSDSELTEGVKQGNISDMPFASQKPQAS